MDKSINSNRFYRFLEWLMWLMYLNVLWMLSSLAGLVVLGVFPATMALVITMREWCMQQESMTFHKTFFKAYKQIFIKANLIGYLLLAIGYVFVIDYQWIMHNQTSLQSLYLVAFILFGICFLITLMYIFPTFAHFQVSLPQSFKHALILGTFSPLITVIMFTALFLLQYLWRFIPGLLPVIGISLTFYIITRLSIMAFEGFEKKQQMLFEKEYRKGAKKHA
ncbi:YesL family protein [Gracilibacillus caseinilyticus]|uniref:YesL family protein n=1 Tax=Gracilibacillus caseinilyticus TaxID=2932256 RepID=A0ABY4F1U1_9BACI|nr:YesL family protein [Gracilibacillus caseinilyticus]UOQ48386.1 YesL family protein [Gracilibacillus caseinilyticus]